MPAAEQQGAGALPPPRVCTVRADLSGCLLCCMVPAAPRGRRLAPGAGHKLPAGGQRYPLKAQKHGLGPPRGRGCAGLSPWARGCWWCCCPQRTRPALHSQLLGCLGLQSDRGGEVGGVAATTSHIHLISGWDPRESLKPWRSVSPERAGLRPGRWAGRRAGLGGSPSSPVAESDSLLLATPAERVQLPGVPDPARPRVPFTCRRGPSQGPRTRMWAHVLELSIRPPPGGGAACVGSVGFTG